MNTSENILWKEYNGKNLLLIAMCLVLVTHGILIYFTLPQTYDAYVHIFFADHYARFWFEPWEYRWYTGFLTISYPPLVHQMIALISKIFPLKIAFSIYAIIVLEILVIGVYRFSKLFYDKTTAGVAAIIVVLLSSIVETLHIFGQLPTLTGMAFLLNALPFLYLYIKNRKFIYLVMALAFLSVTVCSHHVTAIFGMFFFIWPTVFMALADELPAFYKSKNAVAYCTALLKIGIRKYRLLLIFGILMVLLMVALIFPYWFWSKTDPITQVPIPHGSRDNFFKNPSSGLVFFVIPLMLILALLPAIIFSVFWQRRFWAWGASFLLCLILGTGGSTPIPRLMLGTNAFNILTLDRFGFWATIIAIPFMAKFIYAFINGSVRHCWQRNFSTRIYFILTAATGFFYFLFIVFIFNLGSFRPLQPKEIDVQPILNFLNRDEHMRWRYLALGFGDQMAWLSANTLAATVDGNYHSARRLPELTSRPVERLENAKYNGDNGLASLNDFLSNAEKYNLKYVFNNDRYYDPLLYYTGWSRVVRLENGVMVWQKGNITTIHPVLPKQLNTTMKFAWGIIPISSILITFLLSLLYVKSFRVDNSRSPWNVTTDYYPRAVIYTSSLLPVVFFCAFIFIEIHEMLLLKKQQTPRETIVNYYNDLDFQHFEAAFNFFTPTPSYTLDQYMLEKSVSDGGLIPSYAKLDSIGVVETKRNDDSAWVKVYTNWHTSLGNIKKTETFKLINKEKKWFILPPKFVSDVPDEQVRGYTFALFKKQGKRLISSFPTTKDDRVKKPFIAIRQVNVIRNGKDNFLTGEILNADDFPTNIGMKVTVHFANNTEKHFFPERAMLYNLAPKEHSFFQVQLSSSRVLDSLKIKSVELRVETDVSDCGYIHGGTPGINVVKTSYGQLQITTMLYNELTTDIAIPGILVAEKDAAGIIWQTKFILYSKAVRSGMSVKFISSIESIREKAIRLKNIPIDVIVNGMPRSVLPIQKDGMANKNNGIAVLPHCYIPQEIYLQ
ncbi:MAG: hypothetical protein ACK5NK_03015 [Niabella sp.]